VEQRLEKLAASNQRLAREVVRRRTAETALRKSERHQRKMLADAERVQVQMRDLSRRLLIAQEEERSHISRELHDDVLQTLVGINVHLETLGREAEIDLVRLRKRIAGAQSIVADSVRAVHRFARELRPMILDDLGVLPAIRTHLEEFQRRTGIVAHFKWFPEVEKLSDARRTVIFRVVQAALSNVAHHSGARQAKISLQEKKEGTILEIRDDGRSFDVVRTLNAKRYKRLGLLGMRERVEMVGGVFEIESTPDHGTTIRASFPSGNSPREKPPTVKGRTFL
jgi:signal transduction histidine kinase